MADGQPSEQLERSGRIDRRRLLSAMTVGATTTGLAGCFGDTSDDPDGNGGNGANGGDGGNGGNGDGGGVVAEGIHGDPIEWDSANTNLFSPTGISGMNYLMSGYWNTMLSALGQPDADSPVCLIQLEEPVKPVEGGCILEYNFVEDGGTWWDGTPITAKDYAIELRLRDYISDGGTENLPHEYELVDDYTLRIHRQSPMGAELAELEGWQDIIFTRYDFWEPWLERYEDAGTEDEITSITQEILDYHITIDEYMEEGLGNGLYKPAEVTNTEIINELHEGHQFAHMTNVEREVFQIISERQKQVEATKNGLVDVGNAREHPDFGDAVEPIYHNQNSAGQNLRFNRRNKHLDRRAVRQAFAYLIDRNQIRELIKANFDNEYVPIEYQTGTTPGQAARWAGDDSDAFLDSLIDYGAASQPEKAEEKMREAGYTKEGGLWVDSDGDAIEELRYITPPWDAYKAVAQVHKPLFDDFGFGTELLISDGVNYDNVMGQTHEWELTNFYFKNRHPREMLRSSFGQIWDSSSDGGGPVVEGRPQNPDEGCGRHVAQPDLLQEREPQYWQPVQATFPEEVGAEEVSGDGTEFNAHLWDQVLTQTQSDEEFTNYAKNLMWYINWSVPEINYYVESYPIFGNTEKFDYSYEEGCASRNKDALYWQRTGANDT